MHKNAIWDRTPPNLHINCSLHVCRRVQGSQVFKWKSIILIRSKVMAFLVILLSPSSPCCPRHPHIIPIVPTSSPCHPHCPHIVPIAPRKSPCGPHGCGVRGLRGLHPMLSPWSPCGPRGSHIIPVISMSSPRHLEGFHIMPNLPDTHSTQFPPPGDGGPRIIKNAIRFELIEIF